MSSTIGAGASHPGLRPDRNKLLRLPAATDASSSTAEVFGRDVIEELAELLDLVLLLVRDRHACLIKYLVLGEDRRPGPQRERDRIRRPGADCLPVREHQVGEEDPIPQR